MGVDRAGDLRVQAELVELLGGVAGIPPVEGGDLHRHAGDGRTVGLDELLVRQVLLHRLHGLAPDRACGAGAGRGVQVLTGERDARQRPPVAGLVHPSHHRSGRQVRCVADEPDRALVVGGPRLPGRGLVGGDVVAEPTRRRDPLQYRVDRIGVRRLHHPVALCPVDRNLLALPVPDLQDRGGVAVHAASGERGVGLGHRQRAGVGHTEGERRRPGLAGVLLELLHPHVDGEVPRFAQPRHLFQLDEERVHRVRRPGVEVHVAGPGGVRRGPWCRQLVGPVTTGPRVAGLEVEGGRGVDLVVQRDALHDGRGQHEDLERRPRLEAVCVTVLLRDGVVEERLAVVGVGAEGTGLRDRTDVAGTRLHHRQAADRVVLGVDVVPDRLDGGLLELRLQCRLDGQPTAVQQLLALCHGLAEV